MPSWTAPRSGEQWTGCWGSLSGSPGGDHLGTLGSSWWMIIGSGSQKGAGRNGTSGSAYALSFSTTLGRRGAPVAVIRPRVGGIWWQQSSVEQQLMSPPLSDVTGPERGWMKLGRRLGGSLAVSLVGILPCRWRPSRLFGLAKGSCVGFRVLGLGLALQLVPHLTGFRGCVQDSPFHFVSASSIEPPLRLASSHDLAATCAGTWGG